MLGAPSSISQKQRAKYPVYHGRGWRGYIDEAPTPQRAISGGVLYGRQGRSATLGRLAGSRAVSVNLNGAVIDVRSKQPYDAFFVRNKDDIPYLSERERYWCFLLFNELNNASCDTLSQANVIGAIFAPKEYEQLVDRLNALVTRAAKLHKGVPPDSEAIATIKAILRLDFEGGVEIAKRLIRPYKTLPFRVGYFQLSIVGALIAALRNEHPRRGFTDWVWSEVANLRENLAAFSDRSIAIALLASLTAVGLLSETPEVAGEQKLAKELLCSSNALLNPDERLRFFGFMVECLNQGVTSENLISQAGKLLVFFEKVPQDTELVRTQHLLLSRLRSALTTPSSPSKG